MEEVVPDQSRLLDSTAPVPSDTPAVSSDTSRAIRGRDLWTPDKAADYLGTARQTLAKWRCLKIGPAYYRIGGRILYLKEDLDAFIAGSRVDAA
jgi:hypothetical protein